MFGAEHIAVIRRLLMDSDVFTGEVIGEVPALGAAEMLAVLPDDTSSRTLLASAAALSKAACSRAANWRSISFALARSTGWPRLPSLPVSVASTA